MKKKMEKENLTVVVPESKIYEATSVGSSNHHRSVAFGMVGGSIVGSL